MAALITRGDASPIDPRKTFLRKHVDAMLANSSEVLPVQHLLRLARHQGIKDEERLRSMGCWLLAEFFGEETVRCPEDPPCASTDAVECWTAQRDCPDFGVWRPLRVRPLDAEVELPGGAIRSFTDLLTAHAGRQ